MLKCDFTSFMVNNMQNLRDKRSEGKNGIFFLTYTCEILLPGQILMRVNKRDVVWWSKNTPLHFFSLSHLLPVHVHSISTIITALQVEFHKGERLSLSASGLELD